MGKYKELAADIVAHVGGKENVTGLRHCFTRLRFNLADDKKADTAYLKNRDGVISVVNSGGEYMVVIGEHTQCIAMGHDIVINPKQLLCPLLQRHILLPLFLSEILLRKGRTMINHRTIQSHDRKHE